MKFERYTRYEAITLTDRKAAAFARKLVKERARYPLFPEHVSTEQHNLDTEMTRRARAFNATEANMRAFHSKTWRSARAQYFSLPEDVRRQILTKWNTWVGPRTATYFSWVVDTLSGEQAARSERYALADKARRATAPTARYAATAPLF